MWHNCSVNSSHNLSWMEKVFYIVTWGSLSERRGTVLDTLILKLKIISENKMVDASGYTKNTESSSLLLKFNTFFIKYSFFTVRCLPICLVALAGLLCCICAKVWRDNKHKKDHKYLSLMPRWLKKPKQISSWQKQPPYVWINHQRSVLYGWGQAERRQGNRSTNCSNDGNKYCCLKIIQDTWCYIKHVWSEQKNLSQNLHRGRFPPKRKKTDEKKWNMVIMPLCILASWWEKYF